MGHSAWLPKTFDGSSHGTMECRSCHDRVTEGDYRVREQTKGYELQEYQVEHRQCCPSWEGWKLHDRSQERRRDKAAQRLRAYQEFRDRWDEPALDEAIAQLRQELGLEVVE